MEGARPGSPEVVPNISSSSSPTLAGVRLGMSLMLHMPKFRYLRLNSPQRPSEMYSSFLSSPRSRRMREGNVLKA